MYITWTLTEKQFVLENSPKMSDTQLYEELKKMGANHTINSVRKYRQRLGLKKRVSPLGENNE